MKSLLIALVLASAPAFAQENRYNYEEPVVDYISWCEDNKVVGADTSGNPYIRRDCSETQQVCKVTSLYRLHRTIVTAACLDK